MQATCMSSKFLYESLSKRKERKANFDNILFNPIYPT